MPRCVALVCAAALLLLVALPPSTVAAVRPGETPPARVAVVGAGGNHAFEPTVAVGDLEQAVQARQKAGAEHRKPNPVPRRTAADPAHGHMVDTYAHGKARRRAAGGSTHARPSRSTPATTGWLHVAAEYLGLGTTADAVRSIGSGMVPPHTAEALREWPQAMRGIRALARAVWVTDDAAYTAALAADRDLGTAPSSRWDAMDAKAAMPDHYRRLYNVGDVPDDVPDGVTGAPRRLEGNCGVGKPATTQVTVYRCDGVEVTQAQYTAILAAQAFANATANGATNITFGNTTIPIIPPQINVSNATCTEEQEYVATCACPYDYTGDACQTKLPLTCAPQLEDAGYQECARNNAAAWGASQFLLQYSSRHDGMPPCLTLTDVTRLEFSVECGFPYLPVPVCNGTNITSDRMDDPDNEPPFYGLENCVEETFMYWVPPEATNRRFSITAMPPQATTLFFRPINWDLLSDTAGELQANVTRGVYNGTARLVLPYPKAGVPESAWAAGRVTVGISTGASPPPSNPATFVPVLLVAEQQGYKPPPPVDDTDVGLIVGMVVLAVVVVVAAVAVWWRFGRAKPATKKGLLAAGVVDAQTLDSSDEDSGREAQYRVGRPASAPVPPKKHR